MALVALLFVALVFGGFFAVSTGLISITAVIVLVVIAFLAGLIITFLR